MTEDFIAEDPSEFWEKRHELSLHPITKSAVRDRESGRHLVFLVDIDDDVVLSQFEPVSTALDKFDCLDSWPLEYLHVTVKVVGTLADNPEEGLTAADEQRFVETAYSVFGEVEPFSVTFPRLNLFPSVVYAEVEDGGRFAAVNERICKIQEMPVYDRDRNRFIPHVALARFTQEEGYEDVVEYLERTRSLSINSIEISEIQLCALDPSEWYPSFETIETFDLHENTSGTELS